MEEVRWIIFGERVEESRELVRVCVMPASTAATNVPNMKHACCRGSFVEIIRKQGISFVEIMRKQGRKDLGLVSENINKDD